MRRPDFNNFEEDPFKRSEIPSTADLRIYRVALVGGPYSGKSTICQHLRSEKISELTQRTTDAADVVLTLVPEAFDELKKHDEVHSSILDHSATPVELAAFQLLLVKTQLQLEQEAENSLHQQVARMIAKGGSTNREIIGVLVVDGSPMYMSFYESADGDQNYNLSLYWESMDKYKNIYKEVFPDYQTAWEFMDWRYDRVFLLDSLLGHGNDGEFFDGRRLGTPNRAKKISLALNYVMSIGTTNNWMEFIDGGRSEADRVHHISLIIAADVTHRVRNIKGINDALDHQKSA